VGDGLALLGVKGAEDGILGLRVEGLEDRVCQGFDGRCAPPRWISRRIGGKVPDSIVDERLPLSAIT
jgi:hypothetical protein